jgi:hypothetical protein
MLIDLFNKWEHFWHEVQHYLNPDCVGENYIRHDEKGDRTVTQEAYAAEIAQARKERHRTHASLCTIIHSRAIGRGFVLHSSRVIQKRERQRQERACSFIVLNLASLHKRG